jgi:hypothetical protein
MGGQHHPKRGPAQPQLSGLAAHRPQSPYERRRAAASLARALRQKIQKPQTKKRQPKQMQVAIIFHFHLAVPMRTPYLIIINGIGIGNHQMREVKTLLPNIPMIIF